MKSLTQTVSKAALCTIGALGSWLAVQQPSWARSVADVNATIASATAADSRATSATDKSLATWWDAGDTGATLTVLLTRCQYIDDVEIDWYETNDYRYRVELSSDGGATWRSATGWVTGQGLDDGRNLTDQAVNALRLVGEPGSRLRIRELRPMVLRSEEDCTSAPPPAAHSPSLPPAPLASPATPSTSSAKVPADLAALQGLVAWKITLPEPRDGNMNKALEVLQPQLDRYTNPKWFRLNATRNGVLFTANAGGARTSKNTAYSRSELREMRPFTGVGGAREADWSCRNAAGKRLAVTQRLLQTTTNESPNVVVAQIHDQANDILRVKYFGPRNSNGTRDTGRLDVSFNNDDPGSRIPLDNAYKLGQRMRIEVASDAGQMRIVYRNLDTGVVTAPASVTMRGTEGGCYFKVGMYIQACSVYDVSGARNRACASKPKALQVSDPDAKATLEILDLRVR